MSDAAPQHEPPIPADAIARARARTRAAAGASITDALEEQLGLAPARFMECLGATLGLAVADMTQLYLLKPVFDVLSFHEAFQRNCLLADDAGTRVCVVADPFDLALQAWIEARCGQVNWRIAHKADLAALFARHEDTMRAIDASIDTGPEPASASSLDDLSLVSIAGDSSPVIKLVNSTIYDALKAGASDIHLETNGAGLQVKYRIDGVLAHIVSVPGLAMAEQVVSRIKVMAELDIAERRIPQDGRFKLSVKGHEIDYRVSVMPTMVSEDVVIRVLDKRTLTDELQGLRLDLLGFDIDSLREIRHLAAKPYGMLLVTGPTGSGKTTTMYAALSEINNGQDKIITIEDPVEYQLPGILQIPVNEKKGLTFAKGLRSILRHDPDKIMVGEIRDRETAEIAVQSALTGHLVLTTVHANNVFDVFGRFTHMGIDPYAFVSALNGIWAQRLVRINCPHCAAQYTPDDQELAGVGLARADVYDYRFMQGKGCGDCRGTGYKGRRSIAEILTLNDEIRELIVDKRPIRQIKQAAYENGTRSLRQAALELVKRGGTTLAEIKRVTLHA
jgi:general secretion pathway protein E